MKRTLFIPMAALLLGLALTSAAQTKRDLMQDAHALVFNHTAVSRSVTLLPNGVRTTTTTTDAALLPILRKHPRQMGDLYREGGMVRGWDPVFRELAYVADKTSMTVKDIEGGVEVLLTSEDAEVVRLIQAHANKVTDMAKRGVPAMHEATALPAGYTRPEAEQEAKPDAGAVPAEVWDGTLVQYGTMHEAIGKQEDQGRVRLSEVLARPHFFGVAALAKLAGEVTIQDSVATVTRVGAEGALVSEETDTGEAEATLLIGASVPAWTEHGLADDVSSEALDQAIADAATKAGLDPATPIVFMIAGTFRDVRLHVINGACPMHARLKQVPIPEASRAFEAALPEIDGMIIGVYAKDAVGRITHPGTATHMHLIYRDPVGGSSVTGHLEQVSVKGGAVLRLPQQR